MNNSTPTHSAAYLELKGSLDKFLMELAKADLIQDTGVKECAVVAVCLEHEMADRESAKLLAQAMSE